MRCGFTLCAANGSRRFNAGLALSVNGFYGEWLAKFDIKVTYTGWGLR